MGTLVCSVPDVAMCNSAFSSSTSDVSAVLHAHSGQQRPWLCTLLLDQTQDIPYHCITFIGTFEDTIKIFEGSRD
jgi:hypothetical protein